jgi:hypothetical protein
MTLRARRELAIPFPEGWIWGHGMKRNVGRLGEGFFQQLCDDTVGLACNRSIVDERGWDFLVEFPAESTHLLPLDMQPPPLSTFVQVKSTEGKDLSRRIKLSNALRFSMRPDPCFLVFFKYDPGKRDPTKAYLKHFWSPLIEQTIEAVRKAQEQGRADLHSIKITVSFDKSEEIPVGAIPARMREQVADIKGGYGREKGKLAHFSGNDDGLGPCGLEFGEGVTDDDLVDLALGLRPSVPVKRMAPHSKRFGVTLPLHSLEIGPGELSLEVTPASSAKLVLSSPNSSDIVLPVDIYAPSAIPWIRQDRVRYRIKNPFLDFTFHPQSMETGNLSIDLAADVALSLQDFEGFLKLVTKWRGKEACSQIWVQDRMLMLGTLQVPPARDEENVDGWTPHLHFLRHFLQQLPRFAEDVTLTQRQMIDASQDICDFISSSYSPKLDAGGMGDTLPDQDAQYRIFYPATVRVGQFIFCCLISRMGSAQSKEDGSVSLSMSEPSHLASYVLRADESPDVSSQLLSDLEQRAGCFGDAFPTIVLADPGARHTSGRSIS